MTSFKNETMDSNLGEKRKHFNIEDEEEEKNQRLSLDNYNTLYNYNNIIISKSYRREMILDLQFKNDLLESEIISVVSNNLQKSDNKILFYIAGFDKLESKLQTKDNELFYFSKCLFIVFCIPKELIHNLIENNILSCYFYIGNHNEKDKFLIMNKLPERTNLSIASESGINLPYKTSLITFQKD